MQRTTSDSCASSSSSSSSELTWDQVLGNAPAPRIQPTMAPARAAAMISSTTTELYQELGIDEVDEVEAERLSRYEAFCKASERLLTIPDIVGVVTPKVAACFHTIYNAIADVVKSKKLPADKQERAKEAAKNMRKTARVVEANKQNPSPFQWLLELAGTLYSPEHSAEDPTELFKALNDLNTDFIKNMDLDAWVKEANVHNLKTIIWGLRRWCVVPFFAMVTTDAQFKGITNMIKQHSQYIDSTIQFSDLIVRLVVGDLTVDGISGILKRAVELCLPENAAVYANTDEIHEAKEIKQRISEGWDEIVTPILHQNWVGINRSLEENKRYFYEQGFTLTTWEGKFLYGCAIALSILPLIDVCMNERMQKIIKDQYIKVIREAANLLAGMARDFLSGAVEPSLEGILAREDIFDLATIILKVVGEENKKKFLTHLAEGKQKYTEMIAPTLGENTTKVLSSFGDRLSLQ